MTEEADYLTDEQIVELGQMLVDLRLGLRAEDQGGDEAGRARTSLRLRLIGAALARIKQDEYGECSNCGDPIGYERLKASPESLLCPECQGGTG